MYIFRSPEIKMKKIYYLPIFLLIIFSFSYIYISEARGAELVDTNSYENRNLKLTIEHYYDRELVLEYWITTVKPENQNTLSTLIKKSFSNSEPNNLNINEHENPLEHARRLNSLFAINASGWNTANGNINGVQIKEGRVHQNTSNTSGWYTLGIDDEGIMNVFSGTITGQELTTNYNIRNTFSFSIPIIINGEEVNQHIYEAYAPSYNELHPRQIIGQVKDTNDIVILTVDGRSEKSRGMTLPEAAEILLERNCRIAYNLDGGGSVHTIFQGKLLNNPADGEIRDTTDLLYIEE